MIKLTNINGVQVITEVCGTCKCHIKDLSVNDILIKPNELNGVTLTDSDGNEVTRTSPRPECHCEHCND
tara:strand:+ start:694 stop:900 length:207 start_codon:yes stop_codon:yes gene_type:complete